MCWYEKISARVGSFSCVEGVRAALQLGMGHILVETEAMMAKQAIKSLEFYLSTAAGLIVELTDLVYGNLLSWDFVYVPTSSNQVAHDVAELGSNSDPYAEPILGCLPKLYSSYGCSRICSTYILLEILFPFFLKKTILKFGSQNATLKLA